MTIEADLGMHREGGGEGIKVTICKGRGKALFSEKGGYRNCPFVRSAVILVCGGTGAAIVSRVLSRKRLKGIV